MRAARFPKAEIWQAALVIAAITLVTRAWIFGNPVIGIDEQFYLVAGDRLLHGALPYVDVWDRKPIGLFLIYAAAESIFGDPVLGFQLLAALSVILTSLVLFAVARRFTGFSAALAGAAAYPAWLLVFAGVGGQSPVFYNLPMAVAAWLLVGMIAESQARRLAAIGCLVMLLCGIAIQIKYSAVFDSFFFGLSLLWLSWWQDRSVGPLLARGVVWIACAMLPTFAAWVAYAAIGQGDAFVQANFRSIFGDANSLGLSLLRLAGLNLGLAPFWICARLAWSRGAERTPAEIWLFAWVSASVAGFVAFGVYYDHYVLPLLLPFSLIAALAIERIAARKLAIALIVGLGLVGGIGRAAVDRRTYGNRAQVAALAHAIVPRLGNGCLYVNEQLPILYWLTQSCLPTRFLFPEHLVLYRYQNALGIDQLGELRRILAAHPAVIVVSTDPDDDTRPQERALLEAALRRDYRGLCRADVGDTPYLVYTPSSASGRPQSPSPLPECR